MFLLRSCRFAAVVLVATAAALLPASPASAIDTNFKYQINPRHNSGKCLDVAGASTGNSVPVVQFACNSQDNQRFILRRVSGNVYTVHPAHNTGKCLNVANQGTANKVPVNQLTCNGQANQRFRLLDDGPSDDVVADTRIQAVHSQKCLDIPGSSNDVVQLEQFDCNGGDNQLFDMTASAI